MWILFVYLLKLKYVNQQIKLKQIYIINCNLLKPNSKFQNLNQPIYYINKTRLKSLRSIMPFGRQLSTCKHQFPQGFSNCYCCGVRKFESPALKTVGYCNPIHANMKLYFKQMKRRSAKVVPSKQISQATHSLLTAICEKFTYGTQTLALGLHIYQTLKEMSPHEKFWASCCLIVASKGIELDKNVPYLNRYQRYADKDHTQEEYEIAERTIFEAINFDIQYSTFVTFLNYFLTNGVIFTSDEMNKSLIQYFEDDAMLKAKEYLKKGNFSQYDQQKLALSIIKDTRKKYNISEWTPELEQMTGFKSEQISEMQERTLQPKKYDINQTSLLVPKTQKVVDLKNICIRKKLDEVSISKTLVNNSRPNSSAKQNSISTGLGYPTGDNSIVFGNSILGSQNNRGKSTNNVVLAPISTQYLSNNSIFNNLATRRR